MSGSGGAFTRRALLGRGSVLAGSAALAWGLDPSAAAAAIAAATGDRGQGVGARAVEALASYVADVTGDGSFGKADETAVRRSLRAHRGFGLKPRSRYDYRADLFGRALVDRTDLKALVQAMQRLQQDPSQVLPRPVTVAWHYGWYVYANRPQKGAQVWFRGGGYSSRDAGTEELFNDLKNEFGVSVDAISWADPKADGNLNRNVVLGYMQARNGKTRHAALLYESLISLRAKPGERIDFERAKTRNRLIGHFRAMARTFQRLRDGSPAKVFTIDDKPVIFLYASHTWGTNVDGTGPQYDRMDEALTNARIAFGEVYGAEPFLVGEEMTFALEDTFDPGRSRRSANFDAVFAYHHASSADFIVRGGQRLRGGYVDQVKQVLRATYEGSAGHTSRFTGKPLLVIPSLAAGFSKQGLPTLFANRSDYADFLKELIVLHRQEHMIPTFGSDATRRPAPIVSVGAWNEEWEGHSIFPSQYNRTLLPRTQKGFDYVMALKQAFGWNHYAKRELAITL